MMLRLQAFVAALSVILLGYGQVSKAQAISSFYTGRGPTVVMQDPNTGNFLYDVQASKGFSSLKPLSLNISAKAGSSVASTGYSNGASVYGSIFYQTVDNGIAWLFFKCAYTSGICVNYGNHMISTNVTTPVNPKTGLSAALFEQDVGYRVTYEDINGSVRQLSYSNTTKGLFTNWDDGAATGHFNVTDSHSLATTYTVGNSSANLVRSETVYQITSQNIQPLIWGGKASVGANGTTGPNGSLGTWSQSTIIARSSLPAWNANNVTIATMLYRGWNCLFYIDMNRQVQFMRSVDNGSSWSLQPQMDTSSWPLADQPNAPLAAASQQVNVSDPSASLFYMSAGKLVQATINNSQWLPVTIVEENSTSNVSSSPTHTRTVIIAASVTGSFGLLFSMALTSWLVRRRRKQAATSLKRQDSLRDWATESTGGYNGKAELHGEPANITELDHDPNCELHHQLQLIRRRELEGDVPTELDAIEKERIELHGQCHCELATTEKHELQSTEKYELPAGSCEIPRKPNNKEKDEGIVTVKEM